MTKQDLFTIWWIGNIVFWIVVLPWPDMTAQRRHGLIFGLAIAGNLLYLISQFLRDER